jgi:LemA protein
MSEAIVIVVIVSATTLAVVGFGVGIYNRLIRSQVQTREAWSGIDVQLRRRTSLAPNLVESVRGYAVHERSVFDEVTRTTPNSARRAISRT